MAGPPPPAPPPPRAPRPGTAPDATSAAPPAPARRRRRSGAGACRRDGQQRGPRQRFGLGGRPLAAAPAPPLPALAAQPRCESAAPAGHGAAAPHKMAALPWRAGTGGAHGRAASGTVEGMAVCSAVPSRPSRVLRELPPSSQPGSGLPPAEHCSTSALPAGVPTSLAIYPQKEPGACHSVSRCPRCSPRRVRPCRAQLPAGREAVGRLPPLLPVPLLGPVPLRRRLRGR